MQKVNQRSSTIAPVRPGWFTRWRAHHERVISIEDAPHSIALGLAIGIFFGFTPLWSVTTLLSIGVAWLFNSNKIAAVISVTLHDVILPFLPAIPSKRITFRFLREDRGRNFFNKRHESCIKKLCRFVRHALERAGQRTELIDYEIFDCPRD